MRITSPWPEVPEFPPTNISDHCLLRRPADSPDHIFQIDATNGYTRSWNEFKTRVVHARTALGAPESQGGLGLRPGAGETVGILSPNSLDYVTLIHALFSLTVPACPLSSYSTPTELQNLLRVSGATRLFCHPALIPVALEASSKVGLPAEHIYVLEGSAPGRKSLGQMIDEVVRRQTPAVPSQPVKHDTLAYLMFSSGTSGVPKSVMISHTNLVFQMYQNQIVEDAIAAAVPRPANAPVPVSLGFLPMHHTFGLGVTSMRSTRVPTTTVIMPKWDVDAALDLIEKYKIVGLATIPSVIIQIIDAQQRRKKKADLSSLLRITSGAAYLPEEIRQKFNGLSKGLDCGQGWGMSECTMTGTMTIPDGVLPNTKFVPGSVGIIWPSTEAKILRADGSSAELNEPGELYVRGRHIALGYWKNEKASRETFVDGWLRTGDLFKVDQWGNFFFVDRNKDILKVSGQQVAPSEIEDTLLAEPHHLIDDATVVGVSGGRTSDERVPRAWVVLSDAGKQRGAAETIKVLDAYIQQTLSKYKHLRGGIEVVSQLPKSPTGKVLRRELVDQYEARNKVRAKL